MRNLPLDRVTLGLPLAVGSVWIVILIVLEIMVNALCDSNSWERWAKDILPLFVLDMKGHY